MSKKTKHNNIPPLRFAGFTEEWEEKKLGEVASPIKERNTSNLSDIVLTNSAEFGVISQTDFFDHQVASRENISSYLLVHQNDYVYNPRISVTAPVGPINRQKDYDVGVVSPIYTVFRLKAGVFDFMDYFFKNKTWHSFIQLNGNTGARGDRYSITEDVFMNMPLSLPSLQEQEQIGAFFRVLDELIGAKEEELEKLRQMKAALLEAMFPSDENQINVNGGGYKYIDVKCLSEDLYLSAGSADTPRLRFRGFTDPWDNKFIADVCNVSTGDKNTQDRDDKGIYPFYVRSSVVERINSYTYDGEAILTAGDGDIGKVFHLAKGKFGVHQRVYMLTEIHCNIQFLFQFFSAHLYERVSSLSAKNTVDSIRKDMITKMPISLPSLAEQERIGEFFRQQDEGIAAAKEQIDKLQAMKQACLERMFA